ncbi:MAG: cysteine--tRNA ligase, partial [Gammaproteobacteria bacterium]|nr:cysteine--tRNA ligase [Gammaproteobacteria bacterium]
LASHYRSPLNYSDQMLDSAGAALTRLYTALRNTTITQPDERADDYIQRFNKAMDEDFNTAEAIAVLFDLANQVNKYRQDDPARSSSLAATLKQLAGVLGLLQDNPEHYLRSSGSADSGGLDDAAIDNLIQQRQQAKQNKNWAEADRIRDELKAQGVILEDKGSQTTWRRE